MAKRKATNKSNLLKYVLAIPAVISLFSQVISILEYDARESGRSVFMLCALCVIALAMITVGWAGLLALLTIYLLNCGWTLASGLVLISVLNFVVLCFILLMMSKTKRHLFFPVTRQLLRDVVSRH